MKSKFFFPLILIAGLMVANFSVNHIYGQTSQNEPIKQQSVLYTCAMHPEVIQDLPGNCPKCGMKLMEKKDMPKGDIHQANDSACMKHEHIKMIPDSALIGKDSIIQNTKFTEHLDKDL